MLNEIKCPKCHQDVEIEITSTLNVKNNTCVQYALIECGCGYRSRPIFTTGITDDIESYIINKWEEQE